ENLRELRQRRNTLLDTCPSAVVDTDQRHSRTQGEVHHLGDLLPVHLAQRPAEHAEVLGVDTHLQSVHGAVADHHAVTGDPLGVQPEVGGPVLGEGVQFHETPLVQQRSDALPGGKLAAGSLLLRRNLGEVLRPGLVALLQVRQFAGRGRGVDIGSHTSTLIVTTGQMPPQSPRGCPGVGCGLSTTAAVTGAGSAWQAAGMKHTPSEAELPPLQVVAEAGSTNADLARRAVQDPQQWPHLSGLLARRQVAGRGRSGRSWTSGDGALTFSVLVRPGQEREQWGWLPLLAGAAVVRAVAQHSGPPTGIGALVGVKWPNDVVHSAGGEELPDWGRMRKLAGLLAETLTDGTGVVLGIGVNLRADELPVAWAGAADEVGCTAGPLELAETI